MELNFVQSSEVFGKNTLAWVTEFEATGDFNLHVERNKGGDILVYQRTAGSGYAIVEEFRGMDNKPAIDLDFTSVVYPKFVKIVSESQPTYATIVSSGEVTEIKSQSKEVEVTANGTMDITPDAGFSYLNSVKVKTNVAQSGGGSGCIRYLNIANLSSLSDQRMAMALACLVKVSSDNYGVAIGSDYFIRDQLYIEYSLSDVVAIGVMPTIKFLIEGNIIVIEEQLALLMGNGAIEITEEQFYNLNA